MTNPRGSRASLQTFISKLCPTAAQARRVARSEGRSSKSSFPIPRPTAPELTRITSVPVSRRSRTDSPKVRNRPTFMVPGVGASTPVPSFTTMRETSSEDGLFRTGDMRG